MIDKTKARFDLLVDGELSEAERRELLSRLDAEPNGWRRCALAFLEAQTLRAALGGACDSLRSASAPAANEGARRVEAPTSTTGLERAVAAAIVPATSAADAPRLRRSEADPTWNATPRPAAAPPATVAPATREASRRRWPLGWSGTLMAMTACFLAAIALSSEGFRIWQWGQQGSGVSPAANQLVNASPRLNSPGQRPVGADPWRTVTVSLPAGGQRASQAFQVPAREMPSIDEQWLQQPAAAVPPDVASALEEAGYRVQQHRNFVPLKMSDGRTAVMPVDHVDLRESY